MLVNISGKSEVVAIECEEAEAIGPFAVHRRREPDLDDTTASALLAGWGVTHQASGLSAHSAEYAEGARAFAAEWLAQGLPAAFASSECGQWPDWPKKLEACRRASEKADEEAHRRRPMPPRNPALSLYEVTFEASCYVLATSRAEAECIARPGSDFDPTAAEVRTLRASDRLLDGEEAQAEGGVTWLREACAIAGVELTERG